MSGPDRLRSARIGNDTSAPCELCGNAVGRHASLCERCVRSFGLDAARAAYRLDLEIKRELRAERSA